MAGEFDPGAGGLLGTNDLQQSIDEFDAAVKTLSSTVSNMATNMGNGMTRSPIPASGAAGHYITSGNFPGMQPPMFSGLTPSQTRGAVILGQGGSTSSSPAPTMGQTASGGGTIGGGATINGQPVIGGGSGGGGGGSGGSSGGSGGTLNNNASGGGANGGGSTFGGSGGSGGGPPGVYGGSGGGTTPSGPSGAVPAQFLGRAAGAVATGIMAYGANQYSNMLFYNAYGTQMQAQYGQTAQTAQNAAFGNGNNSVWNAAAGNPQSAAAAVATLSQMNPSTNANAYANTASFAATNAFALTNQGLGAAGAAQLAGQVYNPVSSLRMQLLTGTSSINPLSGKQNSLSSVIGGLAGMGYLGGGSYNSQNGTFSQKALNASFTAGRGTSYMNLQSLGYNQSQIQDIQSTMSQANQIANAGHSSFQHVMGLMNTAEGGPDVSEAQSQTAQGQLKKMDPKFKLSTIQDQGNLQSLHMAQSNNESGAYNKAVQDVTSGMMKLTQAINWLLDHTGLNHALGTSGGIMGGLSSTGLGGITHLIGDMLPGMTGQMGGGAGNVSVTQSMTSQGTSSGSSMSSVSSQAMTAVRDAERQVGKPYVYGGDNPKTSFDCSGLVMWAYDQAGVRLQRTSQDQWSQLRDKSVPVNQVREGDIVFQAGSDGTSTQPGHEALMISSNQIVEAPHTGANIRIRGYNPNEWQHAARPLGSLGGGTGAGSPVSGTQTGAPGATGSAGNAGTGLSGGDADLGLTTDADSSLFSGGGGGGGGGVGGGSNTSQNSSNGGGGSSAPPGAGVSGSSAANGKEIYEYLLTNLFGGSKIAAAGADASIWGESSWNPKAQGTGGRGLIGWTPPTKISDSTFNGGLRTQLPAIIDFVRSNGDMGVISAMKHATSIDQAAELWGRGVERYGIDDVHAQGVHEAGQIAGIPRTQWGLASGGTFIAGERGAEVVHVESGQSASVLNASQTRDLLSGSAAQPAQVPWMSSPAQRLMLDMLSPANNAGRQGGGGGVSVTIQTLNVNAPNMTGNQTTSDVQVLGQLVTKQVEDAMERSQLIRQIREGNTG